MNVAVAAPKQKAKAVAAPPVDQSSLLATVERARKLLDAGDVSAAKLLASGAYDQAKAAAQFAKRARAGNQLVAKARRLQADALLIETRAKMRLAAEYDAAQEMGIVAKPGRPQTKVGGENLLTLDDVGLDKTEIHGARKMAEAERRDPGLVERAIEARLAAGFEPSRRSLAHAIGTRTATKEERGNNLYETGPEGMAALLGMESFLELVLEPSCGPGAIVRALEAAGSNVILSDLVDYGTADQYGEVQQIRDFLTITAEEISEWTEGLDFDLVTNPPYGDVLNAYIRHALDVIKPRKMALLLNINFLAGIDPDRCAVLDDMRPARVIIMKRRLPMMHRDDWDGDRASSQMNTMWLVWERQPDGSYAGAGELLRADWKQFDSAQVGGAA